MWDISSRSLIRELIGLRGKVKSLSYSHDGKYIVSGGEDNKIKVWDAATGVEIHNLNGHSNTINSVKFSFDGTQIFSGSSDGTFRLWDVITGKEIVAFAAFLGSDTQLAAASRGIMVEEIETAASTIEGEWLSVTPDGYYQASPRGDRYLNVRIGRTVSGIEDYRHVFRNPDVVRARLQGLPDLDSKSNYTIQQAYKIAPPTVTIQSPVN